MDPIWIVFESHLVLSRHYFPWQISSAKRSNQVVNDSLFHPYAHGGAPAVLRVTTVLGCPPLWAAQSLTRRSENVQTGLSCTGAATADRQCWQAVSTTPSPWSSSCWQLLLTDECTIAIVHSYSTCMYYSYSTCMYYSYSTCMYYSYSTCMY